MTAADFEHGAWVGRYAQSDGHPVVDVAHLVADVTVDGVITACGLPLERRTDDADPGWLADLATHGAAQLPHCKRCKAVLG